MWGERDADAVVPRTGQTSFVCVCLRACTGPFRLEADEESIARKHPPRTGCFIFFFRWVLHNPVVSHRPTVRLVGDDTQQRKTHRFPTPKSVSHWTVIVQLCAGMTAFFFGVRVDTPIFRFHEDAFPSGPDVIPSRRKLTAPNDARAVVIRAKPLLPDSFCLQAMQCSTWG